MRDPGTRGTPCGPAPGNTRVLGVAGVLLMVGGVALIGTLTATLGSFFSGSDTTGQEGSAAGDDSAAGGVPVQDDLLTEVRSLRAEIADLRRVVERPPA